MTSYTLQEALAKDPLGLMVVAVIAILAFFLGYAVTTPTKKEHVAAKVLKILVGVISFVVSIPAVFILGICMQDCGEMDLPAWEASRAIPLSLWAGFIYGFVKFQLGNRRSR